MTTIRRTWHRRIEEIKAVAKFCCVYDENSRQMVSAIPAHAFAAWDKFPHSQLIERFPGKRWTVRVHSNLYFDLTAEDASAQDRPTASAGPTASASQDAPSSVSRGSAGAAERTVLGLLRRSEEATRPVLAQVYASPITLGAVLQLLDGEGRVQDDRHVLRLDGRYPDPRAALTPQVAGLLAKAGFQEADEDAGWVSAGAGRVLTSIVPTDDYLAYNERRFGPAPEPPRIHGASFRAVQRGRWEATAAGAETLHLTWVPRLGGDVWRLWGGPQATRILASGADPSALFSQV